MKKGWREVGCFVSLARSLAQLLGIVGTAIVIAGGANFAVINFFVTSSRAETCKIPFSSYSRMQITKHLPLIIGAKHVSKTVSMCSHRCGRK
jgi:hypothetical protein